MNFHKQFAATVLTIARQTTTGRVGNNKVFISHLWEQARHLFGNCTLHCFKRWLIEANRARYLTLSPADLDPTAPPEDLMNSRVMDGPWTAHVVCVD